MASRIYTLTDVFFCFGDWHGPRLKCGYLKNDEVYGYLDKLNSFVPPKDRCMQYHCHFILSAHPFKAHNVMRLERSLYIINKNPLYMKGPCGATCPRFLDKSEFKLCATQCFKNIESGACLELFIIENIGKVFFKNAYSK